MFSIKSHPSLMSRLGLLLFAVGILTGLSFSVAILWGEIEVRLDVPYQSAASLQMECPLMLSPAETGKIEAVIVNATTRQVKPVVLLDLNRAGIEAAFAQAVPLLPLETQVLTWTVDGSNVIFERLILVNVFQSPYSDNLPRLGYCSILSFSLFGLTGKQTFGLLMTISLIGILFGGGLWLLVCAQTNDQSGFTQPLEVLAVLTILALFTSTVRWWGLTLFLDFLILLLAGILVTEFNPLFEIRKVKS
ncbi:MAG: hypothetical protein AB1649_16275 [Chloroflexota bacterium]